MAGGGTWTSPKTWLAAILSVADMNTHVRDNLNALTPAASTITTTGTQTALTIPTGRGDLVLFANNATDLTIQGIAAGQDGQRLSIFSIGAGNVYLTHQSGSASAANRLMNIATSGLTPLAAGHGIATLVYDVTTARWRLETHDQGKALTATFADSNFLGDATDGNWALGSGDVTTMSYWLKGNQLFVSFYLVTTTVANTPAALVIANGAWGSFTVAKTKLRTCVYNDNNGGNTVGYAAVAASGTSISINKLAGGTFANSTNLTSALGDIDFEVT